MENIFITNSAEETSSLGESVGKLLHGGDVIAFRGGLGAGKTTFTHGLAVGLGLRDDVSSPTFAIVNEYSEPKKTPLYHFDMYRIADSDELESIGFYDYLESDAILAIEWSENIAGDLPENTTVVDFEVTGESSRKITIIGDDRFDNIRN
ncbi:MAG: tRNA (adenosine(37)-N6)-threonylcarbamoyltransferase complex ATPase subunit type 1 TsaE [Oscillospiraceae bacterium]|nr:tRNA (adenosine(37)-N6)-threonylcarbamoyltransferase complex ATPase subunit type 1 TsaE [Ruminococcus sp.]MCD8345562.1 tRNA (adenosine(37)-N6)-threonylcarbamoyltransferase complex ATPase subunit type 1 TsaE [Oscillospiraceae bacterium]